jgi:hypothetical protein
MSGAADNVLDLSSDASAEDVLTIAFGDAALTWAIFGGRLAVKTDGCHLLLSFFWQKAQENKVQAPCVILDRADGDDAEVATGERGEPTFRAGRAGPFPGIFSGPSSLQRQTSILVVEPHFRIRKLPEKGRAFAGGLAARGAVGAVTALPARADKFRSWTPPAALECPCPGRVVFGGGAGVNLCVLGFVWPARLLGRSSRASTRCASCLELNFSQPRNSTSCVFFGAADLIAMLVRRQASSSTSASSTPLSHRCTSQGCVLVIV